MDGGYGLGAGIGLWSCRLEDYRDRTSCSSGLPGWDVSGKEEDGSFTERDRGHVWRRYYTAVSAAFRRVEARRERDPRLDQTFKT
jgi:hypothetical protein